MSIHKAGDSSHSPLTLSGHTVTMAFYPHPHQFPIYMNAYPMPYPNQEFYPMYPPHPHPGSGHGGHHGHGHGPGHAGLDGTVYFEAVPPQGGMPNGKHFSGGGSGGKYGYNNRKDSSDSGISDYSVNTNSRKTSTVSTVSGASAITEATDSSLEDVKEEMPPYEEPDDDLCEKIVQQVEFYFSDANITRDKFLLKHVRRNKEGFVSLKLVASFKRVKHLTKDWRQARFSLVIVFHYLGLDYRFSLLKFKTCRINQFNLSGRGGRGAQVNPPRSERYQDQGAQD